MSEEEIHQQQTPSCPFSASINFIHQLHPLGQRAIANDNFQRYSLGWTNSIHLFHFWSPYSFNNTMPNPDNNHLNSMHRAD